MLGIARQRWHRTCLEVDQTLAGEGGKQVYFYTVC